MQNSIWNSRPRGSRKACSGYFGYGSNMDLASLRAKGVDRARLSGRVCVAGGYVSMSAISFGTRAASAISSSLATHRTPSGAWFISAITSTWHCSMPPKRTATATIGSEVSVHTDRSQRRAIA